MGSGLPKQHGIQYIKDAMHRLGGSNLILLEVMKRRK